MIFQVIPYCLWMVLMAVLPATPWAYAVRTVSVGALLIGFAWKWLRTRSTAIDSHRAPSTARHCHRSPSLANLLIAALVGLIVFAIWILPEQFDWNWYREWFIIGEGGTQAISESDSWLIAMRLLGSALVISVAEELFFRKWLIDFAGFWWMVALFAVEHDRYLVGAIAGIAYGFLYLRRGLLAAIVAHAITNLVLGLWVLRTGQWQFW